MKEIRKLIRTDSESDVNSLITEEETNISSMTLNVKHSEDKKESEKNSADSFKQTELMFSFMCSYLLLLLIKPNLFS